jgi:glycosyltransferase involved in cell wall biosynthesis
MTELKKRIFFDISSLAKYVLTIDRYSGIQRVLINVILETENFSNFIDVYICFHEGVSNNYVCVELDEFGISNFSDPRSLRRALEKKEARSSVAMDVLDRYRSNKVKYYFQRTKYDIFAIFGVKDRFLRLNMTPKLWLEKRFPRDHKFQENKYKKINFDSFCREGDVLVNFDSSWLPVHENTFKRAKEHGVSCYTLVYDLIPILMPNVTHGMMPLIFHKWLSRSTEYTTNYIAISEATKVDLQNFLASRDFNLDVHVLPLAQQGIENNVTTSSPGPLMEVIDTQAYPWLYEVAELSDAVRNIATIPYVLCVGTIEARKNVWRIAQAWKLLLDRGNYNIPRLVFAGRRGWLIEPFEAFLEASGNLNGWIEIIEGPSDEELAFLYRNCKFLIMASLYEGWGLPVGEALSYGKTAVVSNTSSLPEVGGDLVEYCDPHSIDSIASACECLINNPDKLRLFEEKIRATRLRDWSDVCKNLLEILAIEVETTPLLR